MPDNALDELSGGGHLHAGRPPDGPDRDEQVPLDVVGNLTIADWMLVEIGGDNQACATVYRQGGESLRAGHDSVTLAGHIRKVVSC